MTVIRVINPNSNKAVTDGLAASLKHFAVPGRLDIVCDTLEAGPIGIESQRDMDAVTLPLLARMKARKADAYVIACFSDPGLALCRSEIDAPVFGIMESSMAMALTRGDLFGIIALSKNAVRRHRRIIRGLGLLPRMAGERPVDTSVADSAKPEAFDSLARAGLTLTEEDAADVLIMGCAGMARHRAMLEATCKVPVIDPTQAAVSLAKGALLASINV
ncbi:MAG: aspartate/glutamate racemase family protein [Pseudomonadota bacterium]